MAVLLLASGWSHAQPDAVAAPAPPSPGIQLEPLTQYPSMVPALQIRVFLNSDNTPATAAHDPYAIREIVRKALKANPPWDCSSPSSYDVEDTTTKRRLQILSIRLEGNPDHCSLGSGGIGPPLPAVVLVLGRNAIAAGDKLQVSLANLPAGLVASPSALVSRSDAPFKSLQPSSFALTVTPQAAPGEALTTGAKRDVGQLAISLADPTVATVANWANLFLSTKDLFSTDERDTKSAFAATAGIQRGLAARWYVPASLQETIQGNQVATNLSAVTALNLGFLVPWHWTGATFYNKLFLQAPAPPEVTLSATYTHRIDQLVTMTSPKLSSDDFSFNPYATYAPVYLFPAACTAFQNFLAKSDKNKQAAAATSKQYCLGLQFDGGMYYLPLDRNKSGSQRAEGYGDFSILVPLSDIPFAPGALTNLITGSPTSSQLHIKYSDSVNAANNYARSRQWTFAFEVIK